LDRAGVDPRKLDRDPVKKMNLPEVKRLHYLYQRTSSDSGKSGGFFHGDRDPPLSRSLVGRAYAEVHELRRETAALFSDPLVFPCFFRRRSVSISAPSWLALGIMVFGFSIGGVCRQY